MYVYSINGGCPPRQKAKNDARQQLRCEVAKDPDVHMLTTFWSNLIRCVSVMLSLCVVTKQYGEGATKIRKL